MILQLNIQLKNAQPPIWRRLQVNASVTFFELHTYIQDMFYRCDNGSHEFLFKPSTAQRLTRTHPHNTSIGPMSKAQQDSRLNENEVVLSEFFTHEKNKSLYVCDSDYHHELVIIFEKTVQPEESVRYPRCLKARHVIPMENRSKVEHIDTMHISDTQLTENINHRLSKHHPSIKHAPSEHQAAWEELLTLIQHYQKIKPWEYFNDSQFMIVDLPKYNIETYCTVLGKAGKEFGLAVYLGQEGLQNIVDTFEHPKEYEQSGVFKQNSLLLSFSDKEELEAEDFQLLNEFGLKFSGDKAWPMLRKFTPGYYPWFFEAKDRDILITVLRSVLIIYNQKNHEIIPRFDQQLWAKWKYDVAQSDWVWTYEAPSYHQSLALNYAPLKVSEIEIHRLNKKCEPSDDPVEFSIHLLPEPTQNEPDERPFFPQFAVAINQKTGKVIWSDIFSPEKIATNVQKGILKLISETTHIPKEIKVHDNHTLKLIKTVLEKFNIQVTEVESLPATEKFIEHMLNHFE